MKQGGDDLEDDFVFDDTVALSGDEETEPIAHLDDEDVFLDAADDEDREDDDEDVDASAQPNAPGETTTDASAAAKKRKRREKDKERKAKVRPLSLRSDVYSCTPASEKKIIRVSRGS